MRGTVAAATLMPSADAAMVNTQPSQIRLKGAGPSNKPRVVPTNSFPPGRSDVRKLHWFLLLGDRDALGLNGNSHLPPANRPSPPGMVRNVR